jgi:hypothetical protein
MGTNKFSQPASSQPWERVAALLQEHANADGAPQVPSREGVSAIAAAALEVAAEGLERAPSEPGLTYTFYLLSQISRSAAQPNLADRLARLGVRPPRLAEQVGNPSDGVLADVHELTAAFTDTVDRHLRLNKSRTPLSELAQRAGGQSLMVLCESQATTLFGSNEETMRLALRRFSTPAGFGRLARHFFGRLMREYLLFYLSTELSARVGPGRPFASVVEHNQFRSDFDAHCRRSGNAVREMAARWHRSHRLSDTFTARDVEPFIGRALDRMRQSMRYREGRDGA